jgi:DNA helicase-2/ATP-dependent DNA helicase PcrA
MELLKNLNQEQKSAVVHQDGPLLIVAGAGTGKTTVVTSRIAWLILEKKIKPDEILALTFTEKASTEMTERVEGILPMGYVDLWVSTFHSFCDKILRSHALDIGLSTDYKLLNQTAQWMLVRKNLDKFDLDYYRPLGNPTKFIHALLSHFSRCKDEEISQEDYLKYAEGLKIDDETEISRLKEIATAYGIYQQLLLGNNGLDYGDLVNYTLKLFKTRPLILKKYQEQFKYLLVDEFQDTNWAQYELIKLLLNKEQNLTIVADDDQAIYKFRGASVSNILNFLKDFPQAEKIVLNQNYRCAQEILDLSYNFIQLNNPNRLEYVGNNIGVPLVGAHDGGTDRAGARPAPTELKINKKLKSNNNVGAPLAGAHGGDIVPTGLKINKKLKSNYQESAIIEHLEGEDLEGEVNLVINKIKELKASDPEATWNDFAILSRANNTAPPFVEELTVNNVPFVFYSLRGLYNKTIIMDIVALFKLLDNYHESSALYRVLNIPEFKVDYLDLTELLHFAKMKAESLFSVINKIDIFKDIKDESKINIKKILKLLEKYSALVNSKKISEIYLGLLQDSLYLKRLANSEARENKEQLDYLQQFYKKIKEYEASTQNPTLKLFLEDFAIELDAGDNGSLQLDLDAGPEMVKVMTIHSAKGLEFKYVFIVGLVDKRFPTIERKDPIEIPDPLIKEVLPEGDVHLQEERRLFYVAMTRAKKGLFFTSAKDYGGAKEKKLSRFLCEIGFDNTTCHSDCVRQAQHKLRASVVEESLCHPAIKGSLHSLRSVEMTNKEEKKVISKQEYQIPKHFSYSQLTAFAKCPLQYKYSFILKIPIHGKGTFSFGKTMHSTLQKFFESNVGAKNVGAQNFEPTQSTLLELYQESWIDEWYTDEAEKIKYKNKGEQILKEFFEIHKNNWPEVEYLEKGFSLKIGKYIIKGVIDRIDKSAEGVEIVDYKTGEVKDGEKLGPDDKAQLLLYQIAVEEVFGLKPTKLTFYYLNKNLPVSFLGSDKDKEKLKLKILDQIEAIKKSDFKATPSLLCKYCDYFDICDFRQV